MGSPGALQRNSSPDGRVHDVEKGSGSFSAYDQGGAFTAFEEPTFASLYEGFGSVARAAVWMVVVVLAFVTMGAAYLATIDGPALITVHFITIAMLAVNVKIYGWVMDQNVGTHAMHKISTPIRLGAEAFFMTQFAVITKIAGVAALLLFALYLLRSAGDSVVPNWVMAIFVSLSFLLGATCSGLAGGVGLWISVRANVRVTAAAGESYCRSIQIALRAGIVAGVIVVGCCTMGLVSLFVCFRIMSLQLGVSAAHVPDLMVGFAFGASFVALFAQLGGGIYTKAADVGADIVGKVEAGIPEDDPRNPAVIADLVGDNVGDCAGRGADLFESISAEILGAMILGSQLAEKNAVPVIGFVMFPLLIHAFDLVVSTIGVFCVRTADCSATGKTTADSLEDPLQVLKRGFFVAMGLSLGGVALATRWLLHTEEFPDAWWHFLLCSYIGAACAFANLAITQYYTDYIYAPVREIAEASLSGSGTNVIAGVAVGLRSTTIPVLVICGGILSTYTLGERALPGGGLFGTAVATMGMLGTAAYVLAMDGFGPVADNAGGISEMSHQPEEVRAITDRLDAVGNVTKAVTKGYSIGSAGLACFLLFSAFQDIVRSYSEIPFDHVDFAIPEVFVGGLLGGGLVFLFSGLAITSVGRAAQAVVSEVRRQFAERPGIMTYTQTPDYAACVSIVTQAALKEMIKPGLLSVLAPACVGFFFKFVGMLSSRPLLGPQVVCSFLMVSTMTGILMSLFMNNAGGAWDNAKKYIETGVYGGKGTEAHKAAVTGDTVGDPFKDTCGPAIHVLIKLLATVSLVLGPLFI